MKRKKLVVNFGIALMMVAGFTIVFPSTALAACPVDMVAYWKLDETTGGPYQELIANNDGGVAAGKTAPTAVVGKVGGAQSFNGSNTGINVPASDAFNWAAGDSFSIELWINIPSLPSANQVAVGRLASGATDRQWWVGVHGNTAGDRGKVQFSLLNTPNPVTNIIGTTVLAPNIWYHVVAVRDGNQNRIYVNGVLEATTPQAFANGFSSADASLNIGWLNRDPGFHFNGQIDELALYDRALTPTEILFHYNGGAGNDYCAPAPLSSDAPFPDSTIALWPLDEQTGSTLYVDVFGGNDGDIAAGKTAPTAVAGKVGGAQSFNGSNTGINVPASDAFNWAAGDSFSIELWINIPSLPSANQVAVGRLASGATDRQWWVGVHGNTAGDRGKLQFSLLNTPNPVTNIIGNTVLALNTWHHVVAVRDRNHHRIYLNGNLDLNNSQISTFPNGFSSTDAALTIGWLNRDAGFHLNGQVDELALYDRALTPTEIKAHYNAGVAGNGVWSLLPAPLAVAVADPATVQELQTITLDGTDSAPGYPEALISAYLWEQTAGPTATLTNANTATATAVAPELSGVTEATLTFQLTVTAEDSQLAIDTVDVQVLVGPVADAGSNQSVTAGDTVTLNGSDSAGSGLTFLWEQTAGTGVTLTGATTATATFTAPAVDTSEALAFRLTVTDQNDLSDSDTVEVTVNPADTAPPAPVGGGGSSGCFINTMF